MHGERAVMGGATALDGHMHGYWVAELCLTLTATLRRRQGKVASFVRFHTLLVPHPLPGIPHRMQVQPSGDGGVAGLSWCPYIRPDSA